MKHGTYGGYVTHMREDRDPCEACAEARREYMRRYRSNPEAAEKHRAYSRNRARALAALARRHPGEYAALLREVSE